MMRETESTGVLPLESLLPDCQECHDALLDAQARGVAFELLYAYACEDHARLIRCRIDPEFAEWVQHKVEKLEILIGYLEPAIETRERIDKGKRLLADPTLTISQMQKYQKRVKELEAILPDDMSELDADALRNWLAQVRKDVLYWRNANGQQKGMFL